MSTFTPTDEQQTALAAAEAGETLKIKAYAGAGKTSTLELVAERFAASRLAATASFASFRTSFAGLPVWRVTQTDP